MIRLKVEEKYEIFANVAMDGSAAHTREYRGRVSYCNPGCRCPLGEAGPGSGNWRTAPSLGAPR